MKATLLYRIASVLLVVFAVGHTAGFLLFKPTASEGMAVRDAMFNVRFQVKGASVTYGDFYNGFGLFATAYLLFSAYLAWYLGGLSATNPRAIGALSWAFFALQVASVALSWIYFLKPPVVLSALVAICTGWAALLIMGEKISGSTPLR